VDFGIARAADRVGELTGTGGVMGTPDYMAPERFEGRPISHAVDVYALACVLHKLLTGGAPFRAESLAALMYAHLTATPPRASLMRPGIPACLDWVIARGLAKDPRERFATAGELAAAAHAALSSTGSPTLPPPSPPPSSPFPSPPTPRVRRSRRRGVVIGGVLASVVLVGAGTWGVQMLQSEGTLPAGPASSAPKTVRVSANLTVSGARTLAVDPTGSKLLLSAPAHTPSTADLSDYRANVEIHDLADPTKVTTASLSDEHVDALAETSDGSTIVAASSSYGYQQRKAANTLSLIDAKTGRVRLSVPLRSTVIALALSPDGGRIYLTDRSSSFQVLDRTTGARLASVPLGTQAEGITVGKDGRQVFVAGSTGLKTIDTASNTVIGTVGIRNSASSVALSPDGKAAVVITSGNDSVVGIDLAAGQVKWTIPVGKRPDSLVVTPDGQQALVASNGGGVTVIDLATQKVSNLPVGDSAQDITLSPDGNFGFVATLSEVVRFDREPA
jgi:serine/threonine-protein kinase